MSCTSNFAFLPVVNLFRWSHDDKFFAFKKAPDMDKMVRAKSVCYLTLYWNLQNYWEIVVIRLLLFSCVVSCDGEAGEDCVTDEG